jgi:2-amino-4-hydroxy-6-hydroxymethyldihydropteridine diphosphokinase
MSTAYLLIGGNLGNRLHYLQEATQYIQQTCGNIVHSSSIYESAAWGITEQPSFYNQALMLETTLPPDNLMQQLLKIEENMGRKRTLKLGPRIIDLDILFIDDLIISDSLLTLPHPALPDRRFALLPLNEIAPMLEHPVFHKTIQQLLSECKDELDVQKKSEITI